MRSLALFIGRHAARVIDPVWPDQAAAMYAEIENLDDRAALGWACGCLAAAYGQRASVTAIAVVSARLCVALAAGAFALAHFIYCIANLWLKIGLMTGASFADVSPARLRFIAEAPLEHWLASFVVIGALGTLHAAAAIMLAMGRNDRVCRYALVLVVMQVAVGMLGLSGVTWPVIYVGLTLMMALASSGLAWLWMWDERRMART